jgi:hypothetical protein
MGRDVEPILEKRRHKQKLSHYQEPEQPSVGNLHSCLIVATKLESQQQKPVLWDMSEADTLVLDRWIFEAEDGAGTSLAAELEQRFGYSLGIWRAALIEASAGYRADWLWWNCFRKRPEPAEEKEKKKLRVASAIPARQRGTRSGESGHSD